MQQRDSDLGQILRAMSPQLRPYAYVFATGVNETIAAAGVMPIASIREDEGISVILSKADAENLGISYDYVAAWITLTVQSSLRTIGLTCAVSGHLAVAGISCNIVAGFYHDHLFVPYDEGARAIKVLEDLSSANCSELGGLIREVTYMPYAECSANG